MNVKLVKIFEDKERDWEKRGKNGRKERMGKMEALPAENRK